jgi:hypothetical protein
MEQAEGWYEVKDEEIREHIESGEVDTVPVDAIPVDLRHERITVRFTEAEAVAIDHECRELGMGRSTLIRLFVRQGLGMASRAPVGRRAVRGRTIPGADTAVPKQTRPRSTPSS